MYDPRTENLTELTDDKLTDRIGDLHKRMRFFVQNGNIQAIDQLNIMLSEANAEQQRRWAKTAQAQLEKAQKNNILDDK